MQVLNFLFILLLALGAACGDGSNGREIPPATEAVDSTATPGAKQEVRQTSLSEKPDTLYRISGTEPFWSLILARPRSMYTSADGDTLFFDFKEARSASARPKEYVQVFDLGDEQKLVLRKTNNCPCTDGMSNKTYPYQATLILAEKILEGCGRTP